MGKRSPALFYAHNKENIHILLKFIIIFPLGYMLYEYLNPVLKPFFVDFLHARVAAWVLDVLQPGQGIFAEGNIIHAGGFSLHIAKGCEGIEGILLLIAAIAAFPSRWVEKMIGILLGTVVIYLANILRLVLVYFAVKTGMVEFDVMHVYVGQIFIVFVMLLCLFIWLRAISPRVRPAD